MIARPSTDDTLECHSIGFFGEFDAAAGRAEAASGGAVEWDIAIGAVRVRLRFAGRALVPVLLPALAHLTVPAGGRPDLTVRVWDSESTGVDAPAFPWREYGPRGTAVGFDDARIRTIVDAGFGGVTMCDVEESRAVFWTRSPGAVPWYERAAPVRAALHWATIGEGRHLVHAGAVGGAHGGVVLAGRGGSGKSTLALACLDRGMDYAGDDYVVLATGPEPRAFSVYGRAKLTPESLGLLPALAAGAEQPRPPRDDKAVIDVSAHRPGGLRPSVKVTAIVLPRVTGAARPALRRVSPVQALMALAPSTVFQLPDDGGAALATLSGLAREVPAYAIELGPNPYAAAELIAGLTGGGA